MDIKRDTSQIIPANFYDTHDGIALKDLFAKQYEEEVFSENFSYYPYYGVNWQYYNDNEPYNEYDQYNSFDEYGFKDNYDGTAYMSFHGQSSNGTSYRSRQIACTGYLNEVYYTIRFKVYNPHYENMIVKINNGFYNEFEQTFTNEYGDTEYEVTGYCSNNIICIYIEHEFQSWYEPTEQKIIITSLSAYKQVEKFEFESKVIDISNYSYKFNINCSFDWEKSITGMYPVTPEYDHMVYIYTSNDKTTFAGFRGSVNADRHKTFGNLTVENVNKEKYMLIRCRFIAQSTNRATLTKFEANISKNYKVDKLLDTERHVISSDQEPPTIVPEKVDILLDLCRSLKTSSSIRINTNRRLIKRSTCRYCTCRSITNDLELTIRSKRNTLKRHIANLDTARQISKIHAQNIHLDTIRSVEKTEIINIRLKRLTFLRMQNRACLIRKVMKREQLFLDTERLLSKTQQEVQHLDTIRNVYVKEEDLLDTNRVVFEELSPFVPELSIDLEYKNHTLFVTSQKYK